MKRQRLVAIGIGVIAMMLFGRMMGTVLWHPETDPAPWGERPSIYEALAAAQAQGLSVLSVALPDDAEVRKRYDVESVAAGAMDGVRIKHGLERNEEAAVALFAALKTALDKPQPPELLALYQAMQVPALTVLDLLLDRVVADGSFNAKHLHTLMRWLALKAPDREPVKIALGLIGIMPAFDDRELFAAFGQHDEFTLFASVALANQLGDNAEADLWELAKKAHGWGRVHLVERLADTKDPAIKRWFLVAGYDNTVAREYTAATCAKAGELLSALASDTLADDLFMGASAILTVLVRGQEGPAEGMADYADGAAAVERYVWHAGARKTLRLEDLGALAELWGYTKNLVDERGHAQNLGWSENRRAVVVAGVEEILRRKQVIAQVVATLTQGELRDLPRAASIVQAMPIATTDVHLQTLLAEAVETPTVEVREKLRLRLAEAGAAEPR